MSKVFFSVTMSLDGCIAPEFMQLGQPMEKWLGQWMELQNYVFQQRFFRENLHLGEGGETGQDNRILEETYNRTGVSIMGKRMFDGGEQSWPEEAPFHTPVFVLTKEVRSPWERPGGTTFLFINDGIESALEQARTVAGGKDIRIAGGANVIQQYLNAGLVDEFSIAVSPVLFGTGLRLFEGLDPRRISLEITEAMHSPLVTHLNYAVRRREVPADTAQEQAVSASGR
jgi:dihydrofolate reductase